MSYDIVIDDLLADLKKHHIRRMVLSPTQWERFSVKVGLVWKTVRFDKSQKNNVPKKKGVYSFIVRPSIANHPEPAYLLYVGMTELQDLRTRFLQYFREANNPRGREHVKYMINLWQDYLWFAYAPIDQVDEIEAVEDALLDAYMPPINVEFKGTVGKAIKAWL